MSTTWIHLSENHRRTLVPGRRRLDEWEGMSCQIPLCGEHRNYSWDQYLCTDDGTCSAINNSWLRTSLLVSPLDVCSEDLAVRTTIVSPSMNCLERLPNAIACHDAITQSECDGTRSRTCIAGGKCEFHQELLSCNPSIPCWSTEQELTQPPAGSTCRKVRDDKYHPESIWESLMDRFSDTVLWKE